MFHLTQKKSKLDSMILKAILMSHCITAELFLFFPICFQFVLIYVQPLVTGFTIFCSPEAEVKLDCIIVYRNHVLATENYQVFWWTGFCVFLTSCCLLKF